MAAHVGPARLIDNLCLEVERDRVQAAPLLDEATPEAVARWLGVPEPGGAACC